jgi:hypothetical protein
MAKRPAKPIRVFYSALTSRYYATTAYKIDDRGIVHITGRQWDVTDDIINALSASARFGTKVKGSHNA